MKALSRRALLAAAGGALLACSKRPDAASPESSPLGASQGVAGADANLDSGLAQRVDGAAPERAFVRTPTRTIEWDLGARGRVIVLISSAPPHTRLPLLVALHGRGEALKGPVRGPWGWPRDYALERAMNRLAEPPLTRVDWEGLVTQERFRRVNERLASRPFGGLVVLSPFLPDFDWSRPPEGLVESYGRFIVDELIPKARAELPVLAAPEATGLDGVSLGGCMALRVGFRFPERFGAVGSLQGALNPGQVEGLAQMARAARRKNAALALRVATSKEDSFVNSNHALSQGFAAAGVSHTFEDHLGPHDYVWNRGPGSFELLLFHDGALSRTG